MQNLIKSLGLKMSNATTRLSPDLLKGLAILSDATFRRSAADRKDLEPYWKSEKNPHFSRPSTNLLFTSISKALLTAEWRLRRWYF